jgi:hypothetical protein
MFRFEMDYPGGRPTQTSIYVLLQRRVSFIADLEREVD